MLDDVPDYFSIFKECVFCVMLIEIVFNFEFKNIKNIQLFAFSLIEFINRDLLFIKASDSNEHDDSRITYSERYDIFCVRISLLLFSLFYSIFKTSVL